MTSGTELGQFLRIFLPTHYFAVFRIDIGGNTRVRVIESFCIVTLLHSERPKLYEVLAVLGEIGLTSSVLLILSSLKRR